MRARLPVAIAKWKGGRLELASRNDAEMMAEIPDGTIVEIFHHRERSEAQNRYLHALLGRFCENQAGDIDPEAIKESVKAKHGWIWGYRVDDRGRTTIIMVSTADMSVDEMKMFIEQCLQYMAEINPDFDFTALRKEAKADSKRTRR